MARRIDLELPCWLVAAAIGAFALLGMALVAYATGGGPGVGGDATIYLTSAKNLIAGKGLGWTDADGSFRMLPYSPPFYPLVLSLVGLFASDLVAGARWLNILQFGATIALCGYGFYRFTGRGWLAVVLSGLLAFSPVLIGVQVWAMSESTFLLLGFGGLFATLRYLESPQRGMLAAAAILTGLSFLTRYIGAAFVAAAALGLLLLECCDDQRVRLSLRWPVLREVLFFGVIASLPMILWLVVDLSITGTVGSRSAQPASSYLQRFLEMGPALEKIYLFWLLPDSVINRLPGMARAALWLLPLVGMFALLLVLARRAPRPSIPGLRPASAFRMAALFLLLVLVYLALLGLVQVFTYPPVTLAARMLSPVHLGVLVLGAALLHLALERLVTGSRLLHTAALLVAVAFLGTYVLRGVLVARGYLGTGIGYNSSAWLDAKTVAQVDELPTDVPLISNEVTAIMYFADRPAYTLQEIFQDQPQEVFTRYGDGSDESQRVFREEGGALVLFYQTLRGDYAMYGDQVEARLRALTDGLYPYFQSEDGAIYFYQKPVFAP